MCDAVGSNTQRHEVGNVTHGFIGHPVCECAPPITTCNLRRNDHVSSVVGRDELDEFLRPPQRAVDPSLVASMIARVMSSSVAPTTRSQIRARTPPNAGERLRMRPKMSPPQVPMPGRVRRRGGVGRCGERRSQCTGTSTSSPLIAPTRRGRSRPEGTGTCELAITRSHQRTCWSWLEIPSDQRRHLWLLSAGADRWRLFRVGKGWR
jgi:hypothetical protein